MGDTVYLFVSSSPDLVAEREAIGQAVAGLPVSLGWEIKHTPRMGEEAQEALDFLQACDIVLFVLGADFAAPMGLEWQRARDGDRSVLAYRKTELHSPSAQALLREAGASWSQFASPEQLKIRFTHDLARLLLDRGEYLGLHIEDIRPLVDLVGDEPGESEGLSDRRRGAERGGIILSRRG